MPKCTICGKKFETLSALRNHHQTVHKNAQFVAPKTSASRNFTLAIVIVIVAVGAGVGVLIYEQQTAVPPAPSGYLNQPISAALYQNLTGVSYQTLSTVGSGTGVTPPSSISGQTYEIGGKPAILYIGAEFCPYCAIERWAMVVALSKFGNFTNLEYMISAPDDGNVYTLTFLNANYTSKYIGFTSIENEDRSRNPLQSPNSTQNSLWSEYDPSGSGYYPFIYFNGYYVIASPQFDYSVLQGKNWTQIASQLNTPSSSVAQAVDGAANTMISAICKMDGGNPSSVCEEPFAKLLAYTPAKSTTNLSFSPIAALVPELSQVKLLDSVLFAS
jgi:Domain of unknown function (DUF929)